ncbi:hypothetical protein ACIQUB_21800 [Rhizobium sp. NPDC090275]|uniref:hypothetical protein n=1 Tax=Rhizobium sp. NPDC090275 TaxID=3364498 RepID=UPI00383B16E6
MSLPLSVFRRSPQDGLASDDHAKEDICRLIADTSLGIGFVWLEREASFQGSNHDVDEVAIEARSSPYVLPTVFKRCVRAFFA